MPKPPLALDDLSKVLDDLVTTQFPAVAPRALRAKALPLVEAAVRLFRAGSKAPEAARAWRDVERHLADCRGAIEEVKAEQANGRPCARQTWPPVRNWPETLATRGDLILSALRGSPADGQTASGSITITPASDRPPTQAVPAIAGLAPRQIVPLPLSSILVSTDRRSRLKTPIVDMLLHSIKRRGLLSPIHVAPGSKAGTYDLTLGLHRLVAHERLGLDTIDAIIRRGDAIELELDEIEENLARKDLTVLERALAEKRQKDLYLKRRPETKRGMAGARAKHLQTTHVSFAAAQAADAGESRRNVERRIQIAEALSDETIALISETPLANSQRQLLALARIPERMRHEVASLMARGKTRNVESALRRLGAASGPTRAPPAREYRAPLAQASDGYVATAMLLGHEILVTVASNLKYVDVIDKGPAPATTKTRWPTYSEDGALATLETFGQILDETIAELPDDLAADVSISARTVGMHAVHQFVHIGGQRPVSLELSWWKADEGQRPGMVEYDPATCDHLRAHVCGRPTRRQLRDGLRMMLLQQMSFTHGLSRRGDRYYRDDDGTEVSFGRGSTAPSGSLSPAHEKPEPDAKPQTEVGVTSQLIHALTSMGFNKVEARRAVESLGSRVGVEPIDTLLRETLALLNP